MSKGHHHRHGGEHDVDDNDWLHLVEIGRRLLDCEHERRDDDQQRNHIEDFQSALRIGGIARGSGSGIPRHEAAQGGEQPSHCKPHTGKRRAPAT